MKDLILKNESDDSLIGTLRCEMLSNEPANFEPVEIKNAQGKVVDQLMVGNQVILKINYSFPQFKKQCTDDGVKITATNTNGTGSTNIN